MLLRSKIYPFLQKRRTAVRILKLPGNLPSLQLGFLTPLIPYEPYSLKCIQTWVTIDIKIAELLPRDARICIESTLDRGCRDVKQTC